MKNLKNLMLGIGFVFLIFFAFKKCENTDNKNMDQPVQINNQKAAIATAKARIQALENNIVVLQSEIDCNFKESIEKEKSLNFLKQKFKNNKPKFVENIKDCNDTIRSIVSNSLAKDSLCDAIIELKNKTIIKKDSIIFYQENQKFLFEKSLKRNDTINQFYVNQLNLETKIIKSEKRKKGFWKTVSVVLLGLLSYQFINR